MPADGCLGWLFLNNKDMRPGFVTKHENEQKGKEEALATG